MQIINALAYSFAELQDSAVFIILVYLLTFVQFDINHVTIIMTNMDSG